MVLGIAVGRFVAKLLFLIEDRQAAVDQVRRPGDVVAVRRCQEHGETGDVVRFAQPAERDLPDQRLEFDRDRSEACC